MNENITKLKQQWNALSPTVRWIIPTVFAAIIIIAIFYYMKPSEYEELYSGLDPSDAVDIQQYLSSNGIEYTTANEGTAISIKGNVPIVRSELSSLNLPSNPEQTGLSRFNEINIGSTKYDKEIQYQSRMQEELEQSLVQAFEEIDRAKVTLPKVENQTIYQDEAKETMISVAVRASNNDEISQENVKAIQMFVASSVQDVTPDNVQVVDSQMNVLSGKEEDADLYSSTKSMEITNKVKQQIEKDLTNALSQVYGNVNVIANVDINFDEIVQNIESYDPEGTIVSNEEMVEREATVDRETANAVGTDQNGEVPRYEIENLDAEDANYLREKEHLIENFSVGKTVEQIIRHPELRNTNVAVWVDNEMQLAGVQELEEMIAVSSGLTGEAERDANNRAVYDNGSVKVSQVAFVDTGGDIFDEEEIEDEEGFQLAWWMFAVAGLLFLLLLILIIVLLVRRSRKQDKEAIEAFDEKVPVEEEEEVQEEIVEEEEVQEEELPVEEEPAKAEEPFNFGWSEEQKGMRELTNEVTKKFPKETADVIRKLLKK